MIRKCCLLLLAFASLALRAEDDLVAQFQHPPAPAKTHVWWHWMNGNISKAGITADLEAMQRVGVGGAQIFNAECGIPAGPVRFMTPAWHAMIAHAAREADRLGLELGIHNCAGWTSSGGPWVTPALAMQDVVSSEVRVQGPAHFAEALPQPATRIAYYRDIAVLAFQTPLDGPLMSERRPKVTASVANFEGGKLMDRDGATVATLPLPKPGAPQYVQFEFAKPFPAQALLVTIPGGVDYTADYGLCEAQAQLQASADGKKFRTIRPLVLERKMFGPMPVGFTFAPVCERFYRVVFTRVGERSPRLALAELELLARPRMENLEAKALYTVGVGLKPEKQPVPAAHFLPRTGVVDLTKQLASDGRLEWDVPAGQWTILRLGHTPTGKGNHPPAEGGYGLECDKLSKAALDAHWAGMMQPVLAAVGPLAGKSFKNAIIDSYEVGGQNWTPRMREEFQRRRGYDPLPYLPVFSGRVIENAEITARFLFDLRRTISDLFAENYYGRFRELCRAQNLQALMEPYSGPFDSYQVGAAADLPMGEFWMQRAPNPSVKLAASIGHAYGQRVIGAESFTADPATEFWDKDLFAYKALGDLVYCAGINKFVLHRFTHQPWPDRVPGMTMGQWGSHFDRTSTWWEQSRAWFSYCARCQALLQAGRFCADAAYYAGENSPSEMPVREKLQPSLPAGYDFDQLGSDTLLNARVENGRVVLPSGMTYRVLVLPPAGQYTPRMLRKIKELAEAGATLVGPKPTQSPSLENYPACDGEVRQLATALWGACDGKSITENKCGAGKIIWGQPLSDVFAALRVEPDFACAPTNEPKVAYIHRTTGDAELYFVSNQKPVVQELQCIFRVSGKQPELWHPDTGRMELAAVFREEAGRTIVPLLLDPAGSVFVVFRNAAGSRTHFTATCSTPIASEPDSFPAMTITRDPKGNLVPAIWKSGVFTFHTSAGQVQTLQAGTVPQPRELEGAWELSFPPNWGAPEKITLPKLASWTAHENPGVKYFSGTAGYRKTFDLPADWVAGDKELMLDLGAVKNLAEVSLNGRDLGILWKPPFRVDISGAARAGENRLEIKVTNLWCNRLIGDEQLPDDIEWARSGFWAHAGPEAWPTWLLQGQPRPSGRKTFTTWHYFTKDSPLLESGLLGPVTVRAAQKKELAE
jgi:hypothetical protein